MSRTPRDAIAVNSFLRRNREKPTLPRGCTMLLLGIGTGAMFVGINVAAEALDPIAIPAFIYLYHDERAEKLQNLQELGLHLLSRDIDGEDRLIWSGFDISTKTYDQNPSNSFRFQELILRTTRFFPSSFWNKMKEQGGVDLLHIQDSGEFTPDYLFRTQENGVPLIAVNFPETYGSVLVSEAMDGVPNLFYDKERSVLTSYLHMIFVQNPVEAEAIISRFGTAAPEHEPFYDAIHAGALILTGHSTYYHPETISAFCDFMDKVTGSQPGTYANFVKISSTMGDEEKIYEEFAPNYFGWEANSP